MTTTWWTVGCVSLAACSSGIELGHTTDAGARGGAGSAQGRVGGSAGAEIGWVPTSGGQTIGGGGAPVEASGGEPPGENGSQGGTITGTGGTEGNQSTGMGGSQGGACMDLKIGTEPVPPILEFVIDKSTSMNSVIGSTNDRTKWQATRDALNTAYAAMDPGFAVGENFFPNATGGCVDTSGGVNPAPLTAAQLALLQGAINAVPDPTTPAGTPTHDGWREGLRRVQQVLAAPPAGYERSKAYLVLVTDGMPVRTLNCGQAAGDNTAVTEAQFNELITDVTTTTAGTGIKTFVIGVPGSEDTSQVPTDPSGSGLDYVPRTKLSELARAGQTMTPGCSDSGDPYYCHFDMVSAPDFVGGLVSVLDQIKFDLITCSYTVPAPPAGSYIDPALIEMTYTTGSGESRRLLRASSVDCSDGQWYASAVDALGVPTQIELCPGTCDTVRSESGAAVSVVFRCIGIV